MFILYYLMILSFSFVSTAYAEPHKKTVCLSMIVKNESKVITRCLDSLLPIIDYWVIVDTGSTDGTQEVIKTFMKQKGIPGELHEGPWVNFAHNRNESLEYARNKGDYILFIDADEYLVYDEGFKLPSLNKDFYYITMHYSGTKYGKVHLIKSALNWKWVGVLHEYIGSSESKTSETLEKVANIYTTEGARSRDPDKYQKDAQVLETALLQEPNNSRYVFYLAQSYRDAKNYAKAIENYEKRASMGGWDQEVFWSLLQIGALQEALKESSETIIKSYYRAYNYRSSRAEPLYRLANYYREKGDYAAGYLMAHAALSIPVPKDVLFVEHWIYDYGALLELSICAYWVGRYAESKIACEAILAKTDIPQNVKECAERNLEFAKTKITETIAHRPLEPILIRTGV